ncbi:MAG: EAL domain-containing protein [Gallionella sp.]|nr:EAL domain-containing protein [Gallionella sp.]
MNDQSGNSILLKEMGIDSSEVAARKAFLEFTETDAALLKELHARLEVGRDAFSETFYNHLLRFSEIAPLIGDPEKLECLKRTQSAYFSQLTEGEYGSDYVEHRLRVGIVHQRVGLTPKWYIGAYRKYLGELLPAIFHLLEGDAEKCFATYNALQKIIFFDMELALDTYFHAEHQAIDRAKRYAEQIIADMPSGLAVVDAELKVRSVNKALRSMFNLGTVEACVGLPVSELLKVGVKLNLHLQNALKHGEMHSELALERQDAQGSKYYLANISRVQMEEKQMLILFMAQDMTAYKKAEEHVQWLAHFDVLTGLPNRTLLTDRINFALSMAQRGHAQLAVMFLDLDHFKNVNDTLGHHIGDVLLIEVAKRLKSAVRDQDTVSRQGGDEFVLVLPDTDADGAARLAEKLLLVIAQRYQIEQHELVITPSIGIAMYPGDGKDSESLFKCSDVAMFRAKHDGRNNYRFFTQEMQTHSARTLLLENALRDAQEHDQFQLHYQPQMSLQDGRIIGAEALLRWQHPELGAVSPAEFIPIAEASGQIVQIGEWVLRSAVHQLKHWMDSGLEPMVVAVNLSAVQFRHAHLPELVTQILEEAKLPAQYLELELTEGIAMGDPLGAIAVMDNLHERGIRMSIDDFGTGYSSLSYLKKFKVYKLKIDQSFVSNIAEDPEDKAIVSAIISMANSLGMQTIAEGVETTGQIAFLHLQGCNEVQGYYFSKPLPADQFEAFVRGKSEI